MFDFIGTFFQKVGVSIGGVFITVGAFFGATPVVNQEPVAPSEEMVVEAEASDQSTPVEQTGTTAQPTDTSTTKTTQLKSQLVTTPVSVSSKATLQIENAKSVVEENMAVVTWTTTMPAESRLIFDNGEGRVFESENGLSTNHKVHTTGLEESEEYHFKITATTEDKNHYDDHYGTVYALKKYTAVLGEKDGDCQIIVVKDTAGKIAASKEVKLSPSRRTESSIIISRGTVVLETNSKGEIKYCETANTFKLTGTELNVTLTSY